MCTTNLIRAWDAADTAVYIDWDKLPNRVKEELEGIQRELESRLKRCADLLKENRALDPDQ